MDAFGPWPHNGTAPQKGPCAAPAAMLLLCCGVVHQTGGGGGRKASLDVGAPGKATSFVAAETHKGATGDPDDGAWGGGGAVSLLDWLLVADSDAERQVD